MDCPKCGYKAGTPMIEIYVPLLEGERHCCALKRHFNLFKIKPRI